MISNVDTFTSWGSDGTGNSTFQWNFSSGGSGLPLRQLAAIPHFIVLAFIGIAAFFIWFVVQWVILFVARYPAGLHEGSEGYMRWYDPRERLRAGAHRQVSAVLAQPVALAKAPPAAPWPAAQAPLGPWPSAPPPPLAAGGPTATGVAAGGAATEPAEAVIPSGRRHDAEPPQEPPPPEAPQQP